MHKTITLLATLILLFASCVEQKKVSLTKKERSWLASRGNVLRVSSPPNWPPLDFADEEGIHRGMGADYIKLLGERIGCTFTYVFYDTWAKSCSNRPL